MVLAPPVSPLAPKGGFPDLPEIAGVRFATFAAGVKYTKRTDVMLAEMAPGTVVAGTFTRSRTRSAPVLDCEAKLGGASTQGAAILVNSGNSNAFTGILGVEAVQAITEKVSSSLGVPEERVFTSSTGVIGEPLPHDRITKIVDTLRDSLGPNGIAEAARAIMTTDTYAKGAARSLNVDGAAVNIVGIAKGSGMIAPDMGTMLVYIFTDAKIDFDSLQPLVTEACNQTFNCITVDSDTSTSDTLLVAATGSSNADVSGLPEFSDALTDVMMDLALQVVRDGEGATKVFSVNISGATSDKDAKLVAMSIANSPLVKTAIAGEDPNWGRIVMAVGKSGAEADRDRLTIRFGEVLVAENGMVAQGYVEADAAAHMKQQEVAIHVDLGLGEGVSTAYSCDLTAQYVAINADYRS